MKNLQSHKKYVTMYADGIFSYNKKEYSTSRVEYLPKLVLTPYYDCNWVSISL